MREWHGCKHRQHCCATSPHPHRRHPSLAAPILHISAPLALSLSLTPILSLLFPLLPLPCPLRINIHPHRLRPTLGCPGPHHERAALFDSPVRLLPQRQGREGTGEGPHGKDGGEGKGEECEHGEVVGGEECVHGVVRHGPPGIEDEIRGNAEEGDGDGIGQPVGGMAGVCTYDGGWLIAGVPLPPCE